MDGNCTGHAEVSRRIARQGRSRGLDGLGCGSGDSQMLGRHLAAGDAGLVGVVGNGHVHSHACGEGLAVGGADAAGIAGKLTGNHDGIGAGGLIVGRQFLGQVLSESEFVNAVAVQAQD